MTIQGLGLVFDQFKNLTLSDGSDIIVSVGSSGLKLGS